MGFDSQRLDQRADHAGCKSLPGEACDTLKGIGREAGVAKLLPKPTRALWSVDNENDQAVGEEGC